MKIFYTTLLLGVISFAFVPVEKLVQPVDLIFVEGGSFVMGSFDPSIESDDDESNLRDVTVYGFYIFNHGNSAGIMG